MLCGAGRIHVETRVRSGDSMAESALKDLGRNLEGAQTHKEQNDNEHCGQTAGVLLVVSVASRIADSRAGLPQPSVAHRWRLVDCSGTCGKVAAEQSCNSGIMWSLQKSWLQAGHRIGRKSLRLQESSEQ